MLPLNMSWKGHVQKEDSASFHELLIAPVLVDW